MEANENQRVEEPHNSGWKSMVTQITIGMIVGALLGISGTFFILQGRIAKLEGIVDTLRPAGQSSTVNNETSRPSADPEDLITIIEEQQRRHVRESWGQNEHENFSENDLKHFQQNRTVYQIVDFLKRDPHFLDVVRAIRQMNPGGRLELLRSADKPLRPTWSQLGGVSREGQTDAGQEAEKRIATAIVDLVKELVNMPEADFLQLYDA